MWSCKQTLGRMLLKYLRESLKYRDTEPFGGMVLQYVLMDRHGSAKPHVHLWPWINTG